MTDILTGDLSDQKMYRLVVKSTTAVDLTARFSNPETPGHDQTAIGTALDKIENCGERYEQAPPKLRREMNQALFDHIEIGPNQPANGQLAVQYAMLTQPEVLQLAHDRAKQRRQPEAETDPETDGNNKTPSFARQGLSYDYLVGAEGLEPPTSAL